MNVGSLEEACLGNQETEEHMSNWQTYDTVKAAVGWIVDDPSSLVVFIDSLNLRIEDGLLIEAITFPDLFYLPHDLVAFRVAAGPLDRGLESIHKRVDLQARSIVDFLRRYKFVWWC